MKYKEIPVTELHRLREHYISKGLPKTEASQKVAETVCITTVYRILNPNIRARENKKMRQYWRDSSNKPKPPSKEWSREYRRRNYHRDYPKDKVYRAMKKHPDRIIPLAFNGNESLSLEAIADRLAYKVAHGRLFQPATILKAIEKHQTKHPNIPSILEKQGEQYCLNPHHKTP